MERAELASKIAANLAEERGWKARPREDPGAVPSRRRVIEERDPRRFMEAFAAAVVSSDDVFLADPAWGDAERAVLEECVAASGPGPAGSEGWLMIPSGGSSGRVKFARHDQVTIAAAVGGFCGHFRLERANWLGLLPLHHVSGLMAWMRCALTGGAYLPWDWKRIESGDFPALPEGAWHLSLVPTQLQRLIDSPEALAWLRRFRVIFVGGGSVWTELAEGAARAGLPVSLSYGMTETAAMAAAQRPEEFLRGDRSSGAALPHVRLMITPEGGVRIEGESVFRGYFPQWRHERWLQTDDLGSMDASGRLAIVGRRDGIIITGGEKVDPAEVEAALRASGAFADIAVLGVTDADWGHAVVAFYPEMDSGPDMERVARSLAALAAFKRPRRYVPVRRWPRNAQGKLNRAALLAQGKFGRT